MFSRYSSAALLAFCLLVSIISAEPADPFADNPAYSVLSETNDAGDRWAFSVFSEGYQELNELGEIMPVTSLLVNKQSKRLTVIRAMNEHDKVKPRLKMRQILKECWTMTGLQPSELKVVLGYQIRNKNMLDALEECRAGMGLSPNTPFEVSNKETDSGRTACWKALGATIFSSAIRGAVEDFKIKKDLVRVKVEYDIERDGKGWNHVYYEFEPIQKA
ncbi:hypothetical protein CH063_13692 [Colletotrichum higginsianum]|uniref:Uncharacterized protein n=2 Tax=Colletotrichum higginsianum TaxID=80884 RepID=H1VVG6_COLHI|nr:hypothetical protein CH63R_12040 [Colletotrichum higginsianum IMI 349063]OBR05337.1 hypothetical protein CH63R_12040 [Colletotrichum higginsianum IMI 349063]TIC93765.1 hypothetical protein CH35J_009716 [Colletotrichum higginsianum]CCF44226.1 hypothetical protein CH063_13692 [Colletotrichum higginsianum]